MSSISEQLPGKTIELHDVGIKIEGNTISVSTGDCFMQIDNINHVRTGLIAKTTKSPNALIGGIWVIAIAISVIAFLTESSITWPLTIGCGVAALILTLVLVWLLTKTTNHYGLLVGLSCSLVYAFISTNEKVISEAYDCLKEVINTESFTGSRIFNFGAVTAPTPVPVSAPVSPPQTHPSPTTAPVIHPPTPPAPATDYDPRLLLDELSRSLEEIRYSNELSDQYRHQLFNIVMDAKEAVEYNSPADIERSRIQFREFAVNTRDTWPRLFESLWARPNLVTFFRGNS
ncbi:MAG: hypothetical protein FWC73_08975 [Defluviitaleaceae bacterium]|nr:hypothetical protein [Defluviitaleaceae bacterium]